MATMTTRTNVLLVVQVAKACLWAASWLVALWWLALRFFAPTTQGQRFRRVTVAGTVGHSSFFGRNATNYILYSCPVIALAVFALLYLELEKRFPTERSCKARHKQRRGWQRLYRATWTHPVVVRSPLGVLTLGDIVGVAVVLVCVSWVWGTYLSHAFAAIAAGQHNSKPGVAIWQRKLAAVSAELGGVIPFTVALLFLPVTRGSPILRMIDVPFEQAVRYHRWLGHLTMLLVTIHSVTYVIFAASIHKLSLLAEWKPTGVANLPGMVATIAGVVMWATSLAVVRRRQFEFFYSMHHLYLLFFAFYVFHVGWNHMGNDMGPVFLFFVDRFLRLLQSRQHVRGICARVLPSGHIELEIPKHWDQSFRVTPLSFLYINIPSISTLEWHPFSITSSPFEKSVRVCIKPLGDWSRKLMAATSAASATPGTSSSSCPFALNLRTEGPYGHESNYYLRYENLVLIAGGVGVTPFLAILRDLLIRYDLQQPNLPSNVQLIWCVKQSSELAALHDISPAHLYPGKQLTLTVHAYVTGDDNDDEHSDCPKPSPQPPANGHHQLTGLRGFPSQLNLWLLAIVLVSVAGFAACSGVLHEFVVVASGRGPFHGAAESALFFVSLVVGIAVCGGAVVVVWRATGRIRERIDARYVGVAVPEGGDAGVVGAQCGVCVPELRGETLLQSCCVTKRARPNFEDVLGGVAIKHSGEEIGVLVSGNHSLHKSVANACRSHNFCGGAQFHLHCVSFEL